ncbi:SREBP regulating gene protein isoform X2 [Orcinus orca]|uniref:SREBP regulating gene protein isoform X2 n=1 Tax=Orcinus orca TaxID=9733 RepID=UPI0021133BAC|nr:SREBP regulating gene protein isoform X2 [Orcinus orca]
MVNLAAMVWRRLLRKRWVLALVFGLSLVYFLTSTFKQEERAVRDRNLLQVHDHDQPIPWKVQFNLGNSSRPSNQCRNSIQGKHLITDELGYVCERKDLLVNGCCNVNVPGTKQYCCDGCLSNGCCSAYEYCVSCCLQPNKQLLLERFLNRAAVAFQNLFMAVEDHFELCLAKCRTSSQAMPKQTDSYCPCCSPPSAKGLHELEPEKPAPSVRWGPSPSAMRCLPASVTQPGRGESEAALPALSDSKLLALSCSASSPPEGSSAQKHARLALLSLGASVGPNPSATHAALLLGHKDPLLSPLPGPGR